MTNARILKGWILVVLLGVITTTADGQYQDVFDMLTTASIKQPPKETIKSNYVDLNNPLGPKAQAMRNKSYSCVDAPASPYEKGLWIKVDGKIFRYMNQDIRMLENNKFVKVNFDEYHSTLRKTLNALKYLEKRSTYARNIIQTLQASDNKFVIAVVPTKSAYTLFPLPDNRFGVLNNNAYAFQVIERKRLVVDYAPFDKIGSGAEIRWNPELRKIGLAHELSHAYDANYGLVDDQLVQAYGEVMSAREIRALYHENMIRKDLNMSLRRKAKTGGALVHDDIPYTNPLPVPARH